MDAIESMFVTWSAGTLVNLVSSRLIESTIISYNFQQIYQNNNHQNRLMMLHINHLNISYMMILFMKSILLLGILAKRNGFLMLLMISNLNLSCLILISECPLLMSLVPPLIKLNSRYIFLRNFLSKLSNRSLISMVSSNSRLLTESLAIPSFKLPPR